MSAAAYWRESRLLHVRSYGIRRIQCERAGSGLVTSTGACARPNRTSAVRDRQRDRGSLIERGLHGTAYRHVNTGGT